MNFIQSVSDAPTRLKQFFDEFIDMIQTSFTALNTFYDMLVEFDNRIVAMVNNCGSTEFDGLPVNKAIATFHYAVGDIVFYLIYMMVLFGCLFTIYKLVWLLVQCVMSFVNHLKGGGLSAVGFSGLLGKIFFK